MVVYIFLAFAPVVLPYVPVAFWVAAVAWLTWHSMNQPASYPLRMPQQENRLDWNSPPAGQSGGATQASGIAYGGTDMSTGKQIWLTNSDLRQHIFYIGTTGAGKSEALISLVSNAFVWGSGFAFIDGKADTNLFGKIYAMARRFGREDDIRVINY
ncbi:MAG: hypothetical protein ING19_08580, partial [Azospirillum sp.]|nr:hypothetical protein [Azospirillum sp.]